MKIGIIVAMDKEFTQLKTLLGESQTERKNFKDFVIGKIGDNEVVMQQCGIGKVNSTIGAVEMIDNYHPDLIISSGVAGGADINLNVTEVVVATECVYHDAYCGDECEFGQILGMPATFKTPQEYVEKALAINDLPDNQHPKIHAGQIVSGEWLWIARRRCVASWSTSLMPWLWIWRAVPSLRPVTSTRLLSSPSASSATCLSKTPRLRCTSTFGRRWQKALST